MNPKMSELVERIRQIEEEIEREAKRRRAELHADFENKRIHFEQEVLAQQRRFKTGWLHYLLNAELRHVVTIPIVYAVIVPFLLLDLFVTLYQWTCFPLYGIPRVKRRDYLVFDRAHLAYLNIIERFNCAYCSYGNGLMAYATEVVARTEQYWCPIKHARRVMLAHPYYDGFVDYGDAAGYQHELASLRAKITRLNDSSGDEGDKPNRLSR